MADYFSRNPELDKGEDALGRYSIMESDYRIITEKLKILGSMAPRVMIHRLLRKDFKANRLVSKYKWRYLIIKREENLK